MASLSVSPLTIRHQRFLLNGRPVLFRGVVYQLPYTYRRDGSIFAHPPNPSNLPPHERYADRDPLNDARLADLGRDVALFRELGINALWVYMVCTGVEHGKCLRVLAEQGIYVFVGCSGGIECVNRVAPRESYTRALLETCYGVVDAFAGWGNVAGFVVANHVVNGKEHTVAAEVVRAAVRDVKGYVRMKAERAGGRRVPVGVADGEWASLQTPSVEYYAAGKREEGVDFYACTNYYWGDKMSWREAGWERLAERFASANVPVVISEYGSNVVRPRHFPETRALYGKGMKEVFSGGFVYEFFEGSNMYGLVKDEGGDLTRLDDFEQYRQGLQEMDGAAEGLAAPASTTADDNEAPFPAVSDVWRASSDVPETSPYPPRDHLHTVAAEGSGISRS